MVLISALILNWWFDLSGGLVESVLLGIVDLIVILFVCWVRLFVEFVSFVDDSSWLVDLLLLALLSVFVWYLVFVGGFGLFF